MTQETIDNSETQAMEEETDIHPIPRTVTPPPKPKRVLTEAQKLAFMKGREKRAANIQQRKMEKAKSDPDIIPTTPPKSKPATTDMDYDLLAEKVAEQLAHKQKKWLAPPSPPASPPPVKKRAYTRRVPEDVESPPRRPPPPPPPPPASRMMAPPPPRPSLQRASTEFNWM